MKYPSKEEIDEVFNSMPGGGRGWLTDWGYQQFAMSVLERFADNEAKAAKVARVEAIQDAIAAVGQSRFSGEMGRDAHKAALNSVVKLLYNEFSNYHDPVV